MSNSWDDVVGTDAYTKNLVRVKDIAAKKGYILNPDEERIKKVVGLMTMNHNSHAKYYCPCKQSHPLDPQKDITCPCPEMDTEIAKDGNCFCKLFYKEK
jgi:ferredoxin-thioredoxin reductase catalytic subunit